MKMAGRKGAHGDAFTVFENSIGGRGVTGGGVEVGGGGGCLQLGKAKQTII